MLKIVEVHAAESAKGEYVVLQNQGVVTVSLRGWALCTDAYLTADVSQVAEQMFIFRDDIAIKPYTRVVLFTGIGQDDWVPTVDGRQAYCAYWGRQERVWSRSSEIHVLHLLNSKCLAPPASPTQPTPAYAD